MMMKKGTWDKGIDYVSTLKKLKSMYKEYKEEIRALGHFARYSSQIGLIYTAVLLIQLTNGSRVIEALEGLIKFYETGKREQQVRVEKTKRTIKYRTIVIPDIINKKDLQAVAFYFERIRKEFYEMQKTENKKERQKRRIKIVSKITHFAQKKLNCNTHSLRYAFISYMANKGVSPQVIAKMTGHAKLDMLITYTQEKLAKKLLIENVKGV